MHNFSAEMIRNASLLDVLHRYYPQNRYAWMRDCIRNHYMYPRPILASPVRWNARRAPIRHIFMMYGVNLPTDVGFRYVRTRAAHESMPTLVGRYREYRGGRVVLEDMSERRMVMPNGADSVPNGYRYSGDGTVAYAQLAAAHEWLNRATLRVTEKATRSVEYYDQSEDGDLYSLSQPSLENNYTMYESHEWQPATSGYRQASVDGTVRYTTTVIEIERMNHREIVRDPFTIRIIVDKVLRLVSQDVVDAIAITNWPKWKE